MPPRTPAPTHCLSTFPLLYSHTNSRLLTGKGGTLQHIPHQTNTRHNSPVREKCLLPPFLFGGAVFGLGMSKNREKIGVIIRRADYDQIKGYRT